MIPPDVEPVAHVPPLPAIDIAPRAPVTVAEPKTFWEIQAEADEAKRRLERGERVWRAVVASAEASNMSVHPVNVQDEPASELPTPEEPPSYFVVSPELYEALARPFEPPPR